MFLSKYLQLISHYTMKDASKCSDILYSLFPPIQNFTVKTRYATYIQPYDPLSIRIPFVGRSFILLGGILSKSRYFVEQIHGSFHSPYHLSTLISRVTGKLCSTLSFSNFLIWEVLGTFYWVNNSKNLHHRFDVKFLPGCRM